MMKPNEDAATARNPMGAGWQHLSLVCLTLLLLTTSGLSLYSFHRVSTLSHKMELLAEDLKGDIQRLDAGLSFEGKRQQLLLGVRDVILETNPRIGLDQAYEFATYILRATEKYPALDPMLLVSIGIVESHFDPGARSGANARGLYQIWPATGRMLAGMLGWEFTEDLLHDPQKNTEMAALYLDILLSAYNDEKLVLAEYNGGPLNAGYFRARSKRTAEETEIYVQRVSRARDRLRKRFDLGSHVQFALMHRDGSRQGKQLGESTGTAP